MSFKVETKSFPHLHCDRSSTEKDLYGLAVDSSPNSKRLQKVTHAPIPASRVYSSVKAVFGNGVRVPVLKDIESKYYGTDAPTSCRFDIVEKVRTIIKPGTYDTYEINQSHNDKSSTMAEVEQGHSLHRQPTFQSYTQKHEPREKDILAKISPYHWSKYVKSGKEGDARDVLYRNTYCLDADRLRYRSSTLPRISQDRPWTGSSNESLCTRVPSRSSSNASPNQKEVTIIPQQPRGTVVRFREYMKPVTYNSDQEVLEVKHFSANRKRRSPVPMAHMRNMLPMIRQDPRKAKRVERPLKFEHFRYRERGYKTTLFTKPIHHSLLEKEPFHSADTFKEYLESLQMNATKMPTKQSRESRETTATYKKPPQHYDINTHALQSVVDVNKPNGGIPKAPPVSEDHARTQDNRSTITIEIKPSWQQSERDTGSDILKISSIRSGEMASCEAETEGKSDKLTLDKASSVLAEKEDDEIAESVKSKQSSVIKIPSSSVSDSGTTCPRNTPTANVEIDNEDDRTSVDLQEKAGDPAE